MQTNEQEQTSTNDLSPRKTLHVMDGQLFAELSEGQMTVIQLDLVHGRKGMLIVKVVSLDAQNKRAVLSLDMTSDSGLQIPFGLATD
jgi:hypothetical protein